MPCLLVALLRYLFDAQPHVFDRIGGTLLGLFPFITMFIVTSITMLRERVTGTLERWRADRGVEHGRAGKPCSYR